MSKVNRIPLYCLDISLLIAKKYRERLVFLYFYLFFAKICDIIILNLVLGLIIYSQALNIKHCQLSYIAIKKLKGFIEIRELQITI